MSKLSFQIIQHDLETSQFEDCWLLCILHQRVTSILIFYIRLFERPKTHLCPISCAMVKAEPRPMSSLMLQLLSGSHIPATEAKPRTQTHTPDRCTNTGSRHSILRRHGHKNKDSTNMMQFIAIVTSLDSAGGIEFSITNFFFCKL